ncbi:hypothetical protein AB0M32_09470 [Streptomyces sp. NPDC051985]
MGADEAAFRASPGKYLPAYENSPGAVDHAAVREALAAILSRVPGPVA